MNADDGTEEKADTDSTDFTDDGGNDDGEGKGVWLLFSLEKVPDAFSGTRRPRPETRHDTNDGEFLPRMNADGRGSEGKQGLAYLWESA